ncbi:nitroreductase [Phenylobacterium sp.]|jgi:nitroreductase|uniref:nitroreductase n=1 Tax=Phenylobacterium sp. TaxID=1871053 RepID=UPI000C8B2E11|nr:nitroreductase [Phenylobacterium sp.]MAK81093.1 nitroreductase family protein [Phenylobacterium sp.]|tara:strand:- start:52730 stop:53398 length:669 start_codon:yes stop_codon:yes gene_type:complete
MNVSQAVAQRISVRAFRPTPVPGAVVREILEAAARAPSGGNLQPWRVHALTGAPLEALKARVRENPFGETPEYDVYPANLWEPLRTRRYQCGEDLYATIGIPREDKAARLAQLAKNGELFGAPVGLFFSLDRKVGPPQWSDVGMLMQTIMLLAVERGLATCAQEYWARYPQTLAEVLSLPADHMIFSGMALGYADEAAPINTLRTRRDPFEVWGEMLGFEEA